MRVPSTSTSVAITNPLVLYRSLIATKRIDADPAQHRLAIRLGQLYDELIDYEPIIQYGHKLNQISRALGTTPGTRSAEDDAQTRVTRARGILSSLWQRNGEQQDSMALTRVLTNHEAAMQIRSPRGLMLHGEVGTGTFVICLQRGFQLMHVQAKACSSTSSPTAYRTGKSDAFTTLPSCWRRWQSWSIYGGVVERSCRQA